MGNCRDLNIMNLALNCWFFQCYSTRILNAKLSLHDFTYLLLFNFRSRKEQWQHSFAFYVLVLYELQNLRPRAVIWCLHRSKCVVDLPALRRSPCWHATGHRENILASAKHSLRRHKKTLKHTVAVTAFLIGYSSADFAALCCITNIVNSAVVLIDRQLSRQSTENRQRGSRASQDFRRIIADHISYNL